MKAEILADGTLKVTPETGLETYALRMWHQHWSKHEVVICGAGVSVFSVELPEHAAPQPESKA